MKLTDRTAPRLLAAALAAAIVFSLLEKRNATDNATNDPKKSACDSCDKP